MQRQSKKSDQNEDRVRVLRARPLLAHNAHVKNGRRREKGCAVCQKGLDGVVAIVEETRVEETSVVQDHRSDEEGTASYPSSDESDRDYADFLRREGYLR